MLPERQPVHFAPPYMRQSVSEAITGRGLQPESTHATDGATTLEVTKNLADRDGDEPFERPSTFVLKK